MLISFFYHSFNNQIVDVMVNLLSSSEIHCGFKGSNQNYNTGICCFSTKHAALRRKSKDWLARNQDNVSNWSYVSTSGLLFQ